MAHITLPTDAPGIRGPLTFRPESAKHLLGLAETILRQPASLEQGDREADEADYAPMGRRLRDQGYAPNGA